MLGVSAPDPVQLPPARSPRTCCRVFRLAGWPVLCERDVIPRRRHQREAGRVLPSRCRHRGLPAAHAQHPHACRQLRLQAGHRLTSTIQARSSLLCQSFHWLLVLCKSTGEYCRNGACTCRHPALRLHPVPCPACPQAWLLTTNSLDRSRKSMRRSASRRFCTLAASSSSPGRSSRCPGCCSSSSMMRGSRR